MPFPIIAAMAAEWALDTECGWTFANSFQKFGVKVICGGTDNHLFTIDVKSSYGINGKIASETLQKINITVN